MKYSLILLLILSSFVFTSRAQKFQKNTNGMPDAVGDVFKKLVDTGFLIYTKPKHYKQLDTVMKRYRCGDWMISDGSINTLVNADSSIIILVNQVHIPAGSRSTDINYDDEKVELNYVNHMAGKEIFKPVIYSKTYSLEKFNADYSGMYTRKCSPVVEPRFTNNKIIYFGKGGYSYHLYYIYTTEATSKIDEEIKKTIGFLKFKN